MRLTIYEEIIGDRIMQITYKLEKLSTGGFMAYCPAMKPVIVQGQTEQEASEKLLIAAKMYVDRHPEIRDSLKVLELRIHEKQ